MTVETLKHLENEHRNINGLLNILERQFASIRDGDRPDYRLMYEIAHYLTYYPDRYHHPFEDLLYARLAKSRPALKNIVDLIGKQHQQIACEGGKLRDLIGEIIDGQAVPRKLLISTGFNYINNYRAHMLTEEDCLFNALPTALQPADWMVLVSSFHWQPDPVFSEQVSREYQHLKDSISAAGAGQWPWDEVSANSCPACSGA